MRTSVFLAFALDTASNTTADAPEIRRIERYGTLSRERAPRCPVCGAECEWIYKYKDVDAVGCERCLVRRDAWEEDVCGGNR